MSDNLIGDDYIRKPLIELQTHPTFSMHAYRVAQSFRTMTTEEIERINILRSK